MDEKEKINPSILKIGKRVSWHGWNSNREPFANRANERNDGSGEGQWLDNNKVAEFIRSIFSNLKVGENIVEIPAGLG